MAFGFGAGLGFGFGFGFGLGLGEGFSVAVDGIVLGDVNVGGLVDETGGAGAAP